MPTLSPEKFQASQVTLWCFRIVIFLQCVGTGGRYVISANEAESDVYGYLYFDHGWSESVAQLIDDVGAYACFLAGWFLIGNGIVLLKKRGDKVLRIMLFFDLFLLAIVAAWAMILAASHTLRGEAYAELTLVEHAVRFGAPIAMSIYLFGFLTSAHKLTTSIATTLMTLAVASTFAGHGYKALQLHGPFTDLILLNDQRHFHFEMEQSTAERLMCWIGWADIALGFLLLTGMVLTALRWRVVAAYMVLWGALTATSRVTAFGLDAWPETVIRSANWGAPLLLFWMWTPRIQSTAQKNENNRSDFPT